jgi:copper chaperone
MQSVTLAISGMTCGGCVRSVASVLDALEGVVKADVSLDKHSATVDFDPARVSVDQLKHAIEDAGYEVSA